MAASQRLGPLVEEETFARLCRSLYARFDPNRKIREASRDQTEARDFYVNKLGFPVKSDFTESKPSSKTIPETGSA
jgi:hypothetical protein